MTFDTKWTGGFADKVALAVNGDPSGRFDIDWGDGSTDRFLPSAAYHDSDFHIEEKNYHHSYSHDGTYDVAVTEELSGLPAVHMTAFLYSSDTAGLNINGSGVPDLCFGGSGNDKINLKGGDDLADGGAGDNRISGGGGDDVISGGGGKDVLKGGDGDDVLDGRGGGDEVYGGQGNDLISDSSGSAHLSGGGGADTFDLTPFFFTASEDEILDFSGVNGQGDKIIVDGFFTTYTFIGHHKFDGSGPELREVQGATALDHIIQIDQDGDGDRDLSFLVHGDVVTADDLILDGRAPRPVGPGLNSAITPEAHPAFATMHPTDHLAIV